jgi:hypothetical protein
VFGGVCGVMWIFVCVGDCVCVFVSVGLCVCVCVVVCVYG